MFIFKSKNQKKINKLYRELDSLYRKLDRLKEELHTYKCEAGKSKDIRCEIEMTQKHIQDKKIEIIKLEK